MRMLLKALFIPLQLSYTAMQYLFEVMKTVPEHYKLLDYTSAGPRALTKAYEALPRRSAKQPPEQLAPGVYLGIRLLKAKDFWSTGRVDEEDFVGCEVGGWAGGRVCVCGS